jgi:hypothetical protein
MYETGWTKLCWPDAPITRGTVVGFLAATSGCGRSTPAGSPTRSRRKGPRWSATGSHSARCLDTWSRERSASRWSCTVRTSRCSTRCSPSPGPPAGQCGPTVRALGTETVRGRLLAGHGCGCQCLMFPGRCVNNIISAATPFLKRSRMKRGREVAGSGQMALMNTFAVVGLGLPFFLLWRE